MKETLYAGNQIARLKGLANQFIGFHRRRIFGERAINQN